MRQDLLGSMRKSVCMRAIRLPEVEGLPRRSNFAHAEEGEPTLAGGQASASLYLLRISLIVTSVAREERRAKC